MTEKPEEPVRTGWRKNEPGAFELNNSLRARAKPLNILQANAVDPGRQPAIPRPPDEPGNVEKELAGTGTAHSPRLFGLRRNSSFCSPCKSGRPKAVDVNTGAASVQ